MWDRLRYLLAHDFCPGYNRFAWWRHPLVILVCVALSAGALSLHAGGAGWMVAWAMLLIVGMGVAWPWVTILGVRARVEYERTRGREGEPVAVRVVVTNYWPWPVWGLELDLGWLPPDRTRGAGELPPADARFAHLGAWSNRNETRRYRPPCRGLYPLAPPVLRCGFPFGLWHARRVIPFNRLLIVWPGRVPVRDFADSGECYHGGAHLQDKAGTSGELLGTRQYRRGDPLKRIHWSQTAKHRRLITCEQQSPIAPSLCVVLDVDPLVHVGIGARGSRESAIRLAASFAEVAWQRGTTVDIQFGAITVRGTPLTVLDALAAIPEQVPETLSDLLTRSASARWRGNQLVITTDRAMNLLENQPVPRKGRFVVLQSESFAPGSLEHLQLPSDLPMASNRAGAVDARPAGLARWEGPCWWRVAALPARGEDGYHVLAD